VEVIHPRCAGIDVSKKDAKVCVRVQGSGRRGTSTTYVGINDQRYLGVAGASDR
jgi:hypothetical protein